MGLLSNRLRLQAHRASLASPIGLDFGDEQLNLVQLQNAQPPVIRACASLPYPLERAELMRSRTGLKSFLKQALTTSPFVGRKVVAALPPADVRIFSVTYRSRPNETDDQAIARLMEERVGEDLAQFVIDYVLVRGDASASERRAIVLISERGTVLSYLDSLHKAGLEVEALEVGPIAIRRLVATLIGAGGAPSNVLVLNTGERKSYLTMISGQRLLFDEEVEFGERALLEQIALALDITPAAARQIAFRHGVHPSRKAVPLPQGVDDTSTTNLVLTMVRPHFVKLVSEIRRAAMFAASETRGGGVDHVFLMGSVARWPGADVLLRTLAELPISIPQPLALAQTLAVADDGRPRPELVIATGLALRGFAGHA